MVLRLCGWLCGWLRAHTCVPCVALCILQLLPLLRPTRHTRVVLLSGGHVRVASVPLNLHRAPLCAALPLCAHDAGSNQPHIH